MSDAEGVSTKLNPVEWFVEDFFRQFPDMVVTEDSLADSFCLAFAAPYEKIKYGAVVHEINRLIGQRKLTQLQVNEYTLISVGPLWVPPGVCVRY